jgi:electron-transferring-flavoprotein dehydrogenase
MSEREAMEFDVVIVGAGPAGLAAAIRLKQLAAAESKEINVCVLEKGSEVGAHILSGAVIDPVAMNELIPDWKEKDAPLNTPVTEDKFIYMTEKGSIRLPNFMMPPLMSNHGNYIVSLGNVCRWMATQAEEMGVEVYPGFAAAEVLYDDNGAVRGVATGDMGIGKDGKKTANYEPGIELHAKYTFIAEGARGSLAKELIQKFELDKDSDAPKFGIGLKELWEIDPEKHKAGMVAHTIGWPLDSSTGGGSFMYHSEGNQVAIGFVVHLNYTNPHLSPFDEFQRFKTHPAIKPYLEGGRRISYGARAITEGGLQSVPKLIFPGGTLIGCSAGFVNLPRIKGSHNAMKTGMLAAEATYNALNENRSVDELTSYPEAYRASWIFKDLKRVRNVKPLWSKLGLFGGLLLGGLDMWMNQLGIGLPFTLKHGKTDAGTLVPADQATPITYPKPDGKVSFDKLSSVFVSATAHEENQPAHLKLADPEIPISTNLPKWAEPAQRYCPAGVYEVVGIEGSGEKRFQINAQNCVHCKTCDIKDPSQNIAWTVPQGGGGPNYPNM